MRFIVYLPEYFNWWSILLQPTEKFLKEKETCLDYFHSWSEQDQIDFVEDLLQGMCHYQHGTVNAFLKPMLQRDFISLLPKKGLDHVAEKIIGEKKLLCIQLKAHYSYPDIEKRISQHLNPQYHQVTSTPTLSAPLSLYARRGYGSFPRACCGKSSSRGR